jgi:hypothetical protein
MIIYGGVAEFDRTVLGSVSYERATTTSATGCGAHGKSVHLYMVLKFHSYAIQVLMPQAWPRIQLLECDAQHAVSHST